jgi:hypothetical protein
MIGCKGSRVGSLDAVRVLRRVPPLILSVEFRAALKQDGYDLKVFKIFVPDAETRI